MKQVITPVLALVIGTTIAWAQLTVTTTSPVNGATNVPLSTTISLTFSAPLDVVWSLSSEDRLLTSATVTGIPTFSPDKRTVNIPVTLTAGRAHFFLLASARAENGTMLAVPYVFYFTTGAGFPTTAISGTVIAGSPGIDVSHSLVALSRTNPAEDEMDLYMGTVADASGGFTIPYVENGGYYCVAAKDLNLDGSINTDDGDAIGFGDSLTVSGTNVSGVQIPIFSFPPLTWQAAVDSASAFEASLPSDRSLRYVQAWKADTLGRSSEWRFSYIFPSLSQGEHVMVRNMYTSIETMDPWWYSWISSMNPITNLAGAANSSVFVANVENAGGRAFRREAHAPPERFVCYIFLGDLAKSELHNLVTDPSRLYWGAVYMWGVETDTDFTRQKSMYFLGDYFSGNVLGTTDVREDGSGTVPAQLTLEQNYPNPFNPSTTIAFSLPSAGEASLKVFNMLGQEVASLFEGQHERGNYTVEFRSSQLPSGMYFYVLRSNGVTKVQKMMLLK